MIYGVCCFVPIDGYIVGLECAKGRGIILPGGKIDPGETAHAAAVRELKEETGLMATGAEYLFNAPSFDLVYNQYAHCTAFKMKVRVFIPYSGPEGTTKLVSWAELLTSRFASYYMQLQDVVASRSRR